MADEAQTPGTWLPGSTVSLYRVPWDGLYKDVVYFEDETARDSYFDSIAGDAITLDNMTYLKPGEPIKVNIPYSKCYTYNYIRVTNPAQPVPNAEDLTLYYFITGVAMINPSTTALMLQLDVWQTYLFNFKVTNAFIDRGHVAVQAAYNTFDKGNPLALQRYCTVPEGVDIGNDYVTYQVRYNNLAINVNDATDEAFAIIIMTTADMAADWGSESNPNFSTSDGQFIDGLESGCNVYALTPSNFKLLADALKDAPWISRAILSITVFPKSFLTDGPEVELGGVTANFLGTTPDEGTYGQISGFLRSYLGYIPDECSYYVKMLAYPYTYIEMDNFTGSPVLYKPEKFTTDTIYLRQIACAAPPYIKVGIYPKYYGTGMMSVDDAPDDDSNLDNVTYNYNVLDDSEPIREGHIYREEYLSNAIWFNNLPTLSIVNDNYTLYLASTINTRTWQYDSAGWSLAKSNASTNLAYDQAQATLANNETNQQLNNLNTIGSGALNAVGSLATGNVLGAITGAASTALNYYTSNEQFNNNQALQLQFANQNADLAKWSAKGDYQNTIAGINATVQDAQLTAPSVIGNAGGDGFNLANGNFGIKVSMRSLELANMQTVIAYFGRYGYAVHEFFAPPENFKCMNHFSYWKMREVYLSCTKADEGAKDIIRGIFEKGVTVWNDPDDIGVIGWRDNVPIAGVNY